MSNSYFDHPASGSRYVNLNVLTGDNLNNSLDLVSAGFEKLPTPSKANGGYANYAAATGSTNAFVVSLSSQITALADGLAVRFKANAANTGAATINVNALGAKSIVRPGGAALEASDIASGQIVEVCYDATNDRFQLQALVSGAAAPAATFSGDASGTVNLLTGASVASAATINLSGTTGNLVHITGTTTITAVTLAKGPRTVIFDGALTLTHHATNNNLPGGANITTAAGDRATYWSDGTTVYCLAYVRASLGSTVTRSARTSNTVLGATDSGKLVDITSGTFSQTFSAAATLTAGWYCWIRNSGTGDVTLEPDGSEQIDGLTNFVLYPGETRLVQCDGSALRTVMLKPGQRTYTASGTFTVPPGVSGLLVDVVGGGGGGGSGERQGAGNVRVGGGGGGGGARVMKTLLPITAGTAVTVTVGAAGAAGAAVAVDTTVGNSGTVGGTSSFGAYALAYGGGGGAGGNAGGAAAAAGGGGGGSAGAGQTPTSTTGTAIGGFPSSATFGAASTNHYNTGGGGAGNAGGNGFSAEWGGGSGGGASASGVGGYTGGGSVHGAAGGGAAGGLTAANAASAGAAGGNIASYATGGGGAGGTAGVAGTAGAASTTDCGTGGGGAGSHASNAGAAGGAGGAPGGGGGGGAPSVNGVASGAGGVGGRGEVRVFWW